MYISLPPKLSFAVSAVLAMASSSAQSLGVLASDVQSASPFMPTQATDPSYADWFYSTPNYTFCDAKLLASFWGGDTWNAKLQAGWKLSIGDEPVLQDMLAQARQQQQVGFCTIDDADNPAYSWDDLEMLAQYWGEPTANDAKLKVEDGIFWGQNAYVLDSLSAARGY